MEELSPYIEFVPPDLESTLQFLEEWVADKKAQGAPEEMIALVQKTIDEHRTVIAQRKGLHENRADEQV